MVQDNYAANKKVGQRESVHDGDLSEVTVEAGEWKNVFEKQSSRTLKFFPGYGSSDRRGDAGYADYDLEADGTGSGGDGDHIEGQFRWVVYNDAEQDDIAAIGPTFRTQDLRASVSADRTEKTLAPMQAIGAPEDGYLVLQFKADAAYDGYVIEADDGDHSGEITDTGIDFTRLRTT
jgi:hypothetical protein